MRVDLPRPVHCDSLTAVVTRFAISARFFRVLACAPFLTLLAVLGCQPLDNGEPALGLSQQEPIGQARYEELLLEGSGSEISTDQLLAWAGQAFDEVRQVMNSVAGQAASADAVQGDGWQSVFASVLLEHPEDVDGLIESYRFELDRAQRFVVEKELVRIPPQAVEVVEAKNVIIRRSFPLALYVDGQLGVTTSSTAEPDPSYLANHCQFCIPPLAVHEGYPGHHVGFWHLDQQADFPSLEIESLARENSRNMFLLEGWALYSELLMIEHGYYASPEELLAALRGLLHRALRARIDVELHTGKIDRQSAVDTYVEELLMTTDAAETEVRRHFSQPTNKATYFVGLIQILELRRLVVDAQSADLRPSLLDFHDRLLQWSLPFPSVGRTLFDVELDLSDVGNARAVIPVTAAY